MGRRERAADGQTKSSKRKGERGGGGGGGGLRLCVLLNSAVVQQQVLQIDELFWPASPWCNDSLKNFLFSLTLPRDCLLIGVGAAACVSA